MTDFVNIKPRPLIPRMPGSKRRHLPEWTPILSQGFNKVVEYFGGALWVTQSLVQAENSTIEKVIVAESAADLRAIYMLWGGQEKTALEQGRQKVSETLYRWQSIPVKKAWLQIKEVWEDRQFRGCADTQAAAAGLALRVLSFSGITRDTPGSGQLNIAPNKSQFARWANYNPVWPESPQSLKVAKDYRFRPNFMFSGLADCSNTLAICDPPYCGVLGKASRRSGHYISPAYFGHRPHEQFTADMAVDSVQHALSHGCRTVIACNYNADWLDFSYRGMAARYGYSCDRAVRGSLTRLNNNVKPAKRENPYRDAYWVFQKIGLGSLEVPHAA